jgi:MerR family transcriptional regulator, redox-sensitive transcriptional activator SoxR
MRRSKPGPEQRNKAAECDTVEMLELMQMTEISIGVIARAAGCATSAIRYYEAAGLLPLPARINGRRRYDASTVQRLRVIERAQQAGFTLSEIRELFFGFVVGTPPAARWETLARRKLADLEAQVARIRAMQVLLHEGLRCGCLTMEQCTVWLSGMDQST